MHVHNATELVTALERAHDGDTILLADGKYHLTHFLQLAGKNHITISGESQSASRVVLLGRGFEKADDTDDILRIQGCSDVTIAHLTFEDAHAYGIKLENTPLDGRGLSNINIYACNFLNIGTRAIKGTFGEGSFVQGGSIRFCNFENSKIPDKSWLFDGDYISAIDCMRLKDWVISDNYFKNVRGAGGGGRGAIFVWVGSQNVVSERNVIIGCDRSICYGNPSGSTANLNEPHNTDGIIRNNFIIAGKGTAIEICWARGMKVYHNTVLTTDPVNGSGIHHHWNEITDLEIANNIVRGRIYGDGDNVRVSNNLTQEIQSKWFRDMTSGDLHLMSNATPALDKAFRLSDCLTDWDGDKRPAPPAKVDLGADERFN